MEKMRALDKNQDGVLQFDEIMGNFDNVDDNLRESLKELLGNDQSGVVSKRELFYLCLKLVMLGALGDQPTYDNMNALQ